MPTLSSDGVALPTPREAEYDAMEQGGGTVDLSEANFGRVSASEKRVLLSILGNLQELFPFDPKLVPPYNMEKLKFPLRDENCTLMAVRQRKCSEQEREMSRNKIALLKNGGIIRS